MLQEGFDDLRRVSRPQKFNWSPKVGRQRSADRILDKAFILRATDVLMTHFYKIRSMKFGLIFWLIQFTLQDGLEGIGFYTKLCH